MVRTPRENQGLRSRNQYQSNLSTGYNWRVKKDPGNLPHNRLPDIEPRVAISQSMQYRWLNQRNHSTSRQGAFINQRFTLARKTIEGFEHKFKAEEARLKKVKQFDKEVLADHKQKFAALKETHGKVFGRQKDFADKALAHSMTNYSQHLRDTRARIEFKKRMDDQRSLSHQSQIKSSDKKRATLRQTLQEKEERRIRPAIEKNNRIAFDHSQRAQSARELRISRLETKHEEWDAAVQNQRDKSSELEMQTLIRSNSRREQQLKSFKGFEKLLKEKSELIRERMSESRAKFLENEDRLAHKRSLSNKKINDFHKRIDAQVSERNQRLKDQCVFQSTLNRSRMEDASENNKF